ncbi:MAG: hypothetical protein HKM02_02060 [Pseudomonadales bacterium]|nr:hypothetical protein [Pseudomonadales bacterium]
MFTQFMVTCSEGLEPLLADELQSFGHTIVNIARNTILVQGHLEQAYRTCLWSRLASRVLCPLFSSTELSPDALTGWVASLPWEDHFPAEASLAVRASLAPGVAWPQQLTALRVKDGYVDRFRELTGDRPPVDPRQPQVPLYIHVEAQAVTVGLDLSADSLHKRHLRTRVLAAPIKENLAAALLCLSGWPGKAGQFEELIDPMCGSGTLLLEALMMVADHAPGLQRQHWGFTAWHHHQPEVWQNLLEEAHQRRQAARTRPWPRLTGCDAAREAIEVTRENLKAAGYAADVQLLVQPLAELPESTCTGLVITNPPYGERLGDEAHSRWLYQALGRLCRQRRPSQVVTTIAPQVDWLDGMSLEHMRTERVSHGGLPRYMRVARAQAWVRRTKQLNPQVLATMTAFQEQVLSSWQALQVQGERCGRLYDGQLKDLSLRVDVYDDLLSVIEFDATQAAVFTPTLIALREVLGVQRDQVRLGRAGREARPDWQSIEDKGLLYRLDLARSDDPGLQLPLTGLYQHVLQRQPQRCLHLFCHNASLAMQIKHQGGYVQGWEPRPYWPDWAREQWALNGWADDSLAIECGDLNAMLGTLPRQDVILLTPPKSHHAEQRRQGFRWRDVQESWIASLMARLTPGGELWLVVDEKSFQLSDTLQQRFAMREHDLLPASCFSLRGHLRFYGNAP